MNFPKILHGGGPVRHGPLIAAEINRPIKHHPSKRRTNSDSRRRRGSGASNERMNVKRRKGRIEYSSCVAAGK